MRYMYPDKEMPTQVGMYAVGVDGHPSAFKWTGDRFEDALGYGRCPEFFWSEPLPISPASQGIVSQIRNNKFT